MGTIQTRTTALLQQVNMADTQKTTTGAPVITNSYAPDNGLFNCFDDMNSCLLGLFCEPMNLGMLVDKTKTGDMISVCSTFAVLATCSALTGIPRHACYAPGVINTAVAKYGVTEELVACPVYCFCGPCSTCRAHRELMHGLNWESLQLGHKSLS